MSRTAVWVKFFSGQMCLGYRAQEETEQFTHDGWFRTGVSASLIKFFTTNRVKSEFSNSRRRF